MSLAGVQQPSTLWVPERRGSYGPVIIDWAESIGIAMDPEQRRDIDVMASFGPGGRWLTLETAIIEGRQNGKTKSVLLPIALADLFLFPPPPDPDRIIWTSHLMKTSLDTFGRVKQLIEGNAAMSRRVKEIVEAKSEQAIVMMDGSTFEFLARTAGGGRGLSMCKRIVFDEALFLRVDAMGALIPTMRAHPNPQLGYGSSAGRPDSDHLRSLQARGRRGGDASLTLIEYRADGSWENPGCVQGRRCSHLYGVEGCTLDDERQWRKANHAIDRGRMGVQFLRAETRALRQTPEGVLESGREMLGWEESGEDPGTRPILAEDWKATGVDPVTFPVPSGPPVFFLDVAPNGRSASIASAALSDNGVPHLELAAHRAGSDWLIARAVELKTNHPDAKFGGTKVGGVGALVPKLAAAGIELELFTEIEFARGCVHLANLAATKAFTHAEDELLTAALAGVAVRPVGDGLWVLTRKNPLIFVELSPFYAEIGAAWLLEKHRKHDYDLADSFA